MCVWWVCVVWCEACNVCRMLCVCVRYVYVCMVRCGVVCVWYGVCEMGVCEVGLCVCVVCVLCVSVWNVCFCGVGVCVVYVCVWFV